MPPGKGSACHHARVHHCKIVQSAGQKHLPAPPLCYGPLFGKPSYPKLNLGEYSKGGGEAAHKGGHLVLKPGWGKTFFPGLFASTSTIQSLQNHQSQVGGSLHC